MEEAIKCKDEADEEHAAAIKEAIRRMDEEHTVAIKVKDEEHAAAIKDKDEEHAATIKVNGDQGQG